MLSSFVNLYRALCQPSAFSEETGRLRARQRLWLAVRMTPAVLAAQMVVCGLFAFLGVLFEVEARGWKEAVALSSLSALMGWGWALVWDVTFAAGWAVAWGAGHWVFGEVVLPGIFGPNEWPQAAHALQTFAPLALASGVGLGAALRSSAGLLWGMGAWLAIGAAVAPESRVLVMLILFALFVVVYFRAEWYPLDVCCTVYSLVAARRSPREALRYLRSSPIYWREPIWLTLPGLRSLLKLVADQDLQAGIDECLFVILSRPSQAHAGRLALVEIIASRLAAVNSVEEMSAAVNELGQAAARQITLPEPLGEVLSVLQQLAQHAEQHVAATLPYNRRRALEKLRDGANDLARRLAFLGGDTSRLLSRAATRWRDLAEQRLAEMGRSEAHGRYIHNPFVFGQPIEETDTNLFVGRRDTVKEIEVALLGGEQKPALVLWGPRRMGKTSVLLQLPRLLGPEFIPAFVDMQAVQTRESLPAFLHALTTAAAQAMRRRGLRIQPLPVSGLGSNPFTAFMGWVTEAETVLGDGKRLLLCLDEFERLDLSIREGRLPRELMDQIRHLIQHHPPIVLLFAGSHRPDELELNWPDALISTRLIHVSYLNPDEVRQLITRPVPDFPVTYDEGAVERIIRVTRCQPYLVQAVCYELVNHLNAEGRLHATAEDVEAGICRALESAHLYFAEMWRQFSEAERALLRALAGRPEGLTAEELSSATGLPPAEVGPALQRLEARSTVELDAATGRWRFQVPLVALWVEKQGA